MNNVNKGKPGAGGPVLLFDGECALCNAVVQALLRSDRDGVLRFATLQGNKGQAWLKAQGLPTDDFDSLILVRDWESADSAYFMRTDGLAVALRAAGGPFALVALLRILPRALRDAGYRVVARLRRRLFGPCKRKPLGRPEWAGRFIDGSRT